MALAPLATTTDLANRGIDTSETTKVNEFLASASAEVRDAAGVPITQGTFTTSIPGTADQWLHLPGQPVTAVASVLLDGDALAATEYKLVGGHLWRRNGWLPTTLEAAEVTVTITGGLSEVPGDIVDLVCSMVGMALAESADGGYASRRDLVAARVDDYSEQYAGTQQTRLAGPLQLPKATRERLRARFGGVGMLARSR